ncbi:Uncharacterized protein T310_6842 [Rasamsonia emersonii CBS 393.64]|uniref:Antigenic cell wall galactomannoprotein n=1 Tax=Rasamsonia emersonii (strain ATCC 16479 / CBS 393.64 / IMI 116815) TaxID=1408163 RepID=A0A0F4YMY3_RASE3|nr:Uncharacterized protein T310_6842 [Rasamsonia emersonii CBS 393.64]KKA19191.1 Uncharacterized protein T310_6842 [Rasamsonia emersonii CBS 393.64]
MYLYKTLVSFLVALSLIAGCANAAQQPEDIRNACDGLASATYGLKDLVLSMNSTSKSGNMKDVYNQFDTIFDQTLEEVGAMSGSAVIQQQDSMQIVYEAFSNFLVRAVTDTVTLQSYFFNLIAIFPSNTSYNPQASDQKGQVDNHFQQAIDAFHAIQGNPQLTVPL